MYWNICFIFQLFFAALPLNKSSLFEKVDDTYFLSGRLIWACPRCAWSGDVDLRSTFLTLDSVKASFTLFSLNRKVKLLNVNCSIFPVIRASWLLSFDGLSSRWSKHFAKHQRHRLSKPPFSFLTNREVAFHVGKLLLS